MKPTVTHINTVTITVDDLGFETILNALHNSESFLKGNKIVSPNPHAAARHAELRDQLVKASNGE